jgi:NADP-dependent 3-hydroxy acid dehydrogenase YdfG
MTATDLYRNADFSADESDGAALHPKDVADAVMYILNAPEGTVIRDVVIEPQLHRIKRK